MPSWTFVEQGEDGITPVYVTITEEEILAAYYDYWLGEMRRVGKEHLISKEHCIDDFVTIHWAAPVKEPA